MQITFVSQLFLAKDSMSGLTADLLFQEISRIVGNTEKRV